MEVPTNAVLPGVGYDFRHLVHAEFVILIAASFAAQLKSA